VGGKPVLDYVMGNLAKCKDIDEVYIAVSHKASVIEEYVSHVDYDWPAVSIVRTLGWETGGDIKTVFIEKNITDPFVVCYGDNVTWLDVSKLISAHSKNSGAASTVTLFGVQKSDISRFGIAEVSKNRITRFFEKPQQGETRSNLANSGYFVLEPQAVADLPMRKFKIESECFPKWAESGNLFAHIQQLKIWIDIGTIESYRAANKIVEGVLAPMTK
jgi:NDP-sugar pyrophosphorylase family protein